MLQAGTSYWVPDADERPPLRDITIPDLFDESAAATPDLEALVLSVYDDPALTLRLTFAELRERVLDVAAALIATDLRPGDRVLVWATNRPEHALLHLACAYAGVTLIPVNPLYRSDELAFVLERARPVAVFAQPRDKSTSLWDILDEAITAVPDCTVRTRVAIGEAPDDRGVAWDTWLAGHVRVDRATTLARRAAVVPESLAQIQFTSGTTGFPKGVELTQRILANQGIQIGTRVGARPGDRWVNPMPLFHCGGCVVCALAAVATNAAHLPIVTFDPKAICDTIERERATIVSGVPTMLIAMDEEVARNGQDLSSLRTVVSGGSLVPPDLASRWQERYGVSFAITYGQTEFGPVATVSSPADPVDLQVTTVGRPIPHVELDVVVPGTDDRVPIGAEGELRYRGFVMPGYHRDPEATARAVTPDGWLCSGDLGTIDAGGYVRITGRAKEMVIRGGENIAPASVEQAVLSLPMVLDACVVGVPDETLGEEMCVFVRLVPGETLGATQLRELLLPRIARFKIPRYLSVVDAFPVTPSGKVQRFRLRELYDAGRLDGSVQDSRLPASNR